MIVVFLEILGAGVLLSVLAWLIYRPKDDYRDLGSDLHHRHLEKNNEKPKKHSDDGNP